MACMAAYAAGLNDTSWRRSPSSRRQEKFRAYADADGPDNQTKHHKTTLTRQLGAGEQRGSVLGDLHLLASLLRKTRRAPLRSIAASIDKGGRMERPKAGRGPTTLGPSFWSWWSPLRLRWQLATARTLPVERVRPAPRSPWCRCRREDGRRRRPPAGPALRV
jgi:hypothetical protein